MPATRPLAALRAARLFDGLRFVDDPLVVLDGGHVVVAGTRAPGVAVTDLGDVTILPGMVDPHVHLALDASTDPVRALLARTPDEVHTAMTDAALASLRCGVTTVRDLGDPGYRSLGLRGVPGLPTILTAGPPVTPDGGHPLGDPFENTRAAVRAAVRERAERGCDAVAIMAGGPARFDIAVLRTAVAEAHRHGLPVAAHAPTTGAVADALAARVDSVEHPPPGLGGLLGEIVARRVTVGVTLDARLVAAGALLVGTGAGTRKPHSPLPDVVPRLVALGMDPLDALRTVTSVAAAVCGLASRKGRLAPGFDADLVVVGGDPRTDPAALRDVRAVYLGGRIVA
jgi:imidazolonepropionase-like amidohydrolase